MKRTSLIELVSGDEGYAVINAVDLFWRFSEQLLNDVRIKFAFECNTLPAFSDWVLVDNNFSKIKEKTNRLFAANASKILSHHVSEFLGLSGDSGFFITDEEGLGYPNLYWRFVRPGSSSDVGSVHADQWFWAIRNQSTPEGFERVKLWLPLQQNDAMPS
jgi:hypothetical protein